MVTYFKWTVNKNNNSKYVNENNLVVAYVIFLLPSI